jgi:hypothetical protein
VGIVAPAPANNKPGITRSKSLIHPFPSGKGKDAREKAKNNGAKEGPSSSFKKLHSNSYISLPDETIYRRKSHNVDDGMYIFMPTF